MEEWNAIKEIDSRVEVAVISMCEKSGKKLLRSPRRDDAPWDHCEGCVEAWSDVGLMSGFVIEHERLMALLNALLMESKSPLRSIWRVEMRDINDAAVLRRVRMM